MSAIERKAAERLIEAVSKPNFSLAVFADAVRDQHPTHQQTIMRAFMACVDQWNEMYIAGFFDARNRGTCQASYIMRQALDETPIDLPYI